MPEVPIPPELPVSDSGPTEENLVDESLEESFPASDPPAHSNPTPPSPAPVFDEDDDDEVEEADKESFPASDPPGWLAGAVL